MKKVWAKIYEGTIAVVVATGECGRFEMAQNVQCGEGIVLPRKAFGMLLLKEKPVSGEKVSQGSQIQCKICVPWILDSSGLLSRNLFLVRELR